MQQRNNRPGPSASPGRHKRPRLSAPTTNDERVNAYGGQNEREYVASSGHSARHSLGGPLGDLGKSETISAEDRRRARLHAIEAALSLDQSQQPLYDPQDPSSTTLSSILPGDVSMLGEESSITSPSDPKEEAKRARRRAIEEALTGEQSSLKEDVLPSSQPDGDGETMVWQAEGRTEIAMDVGIGHGPSAEAGCPTITAPTMLLDLPPSSPMIPPPMDESSSPSKDTNFMHSVGDDGDHVGGGEKELEVPLKGASPVEIAFSKPDNLDADDLPMDVGPLLDLPDPSSAPAFVTFSRTSSGFRATSATSRWAIDVDAGKVRAQEARFELWEKEALYKGQLESTEALTAEYPDVVLPILTTPLGNEVNSVLSKGKRKDLISDHRSLRVPLAELPNTELDSRPSDPPSHPSPNPLSTLTSTSRNPFPRTTLHQSGPAVRNSNPFSASPASALPAHMLSRQGNPSTPLRRSLGPPSSSATPNEENRPSSQIRSAHMTGTSTSLTPSFNPVARASGFGVRTPARGGSKKFVTPFRTDNEKQPTFGIPGATQRIVNYGTPVPKIAKPELQRHGKSALGQSPSKNQAQRNAPSPAVLASRVFDLENVPNRLNMQTYGISPDAHTRYHLTENYNCPPEIFLITPATAAFYAFYLPSDPDSRLGSAEAHSHMLARGCKLVIRQWVDNHWGLILWKLAGLVRAAPHELNDRWCWAEVMRQLLYRYEREINRGQRPSIRKILEQDTPSTRPMVLTVCAMHWTEERTTEEGQLIEAHPDLVLTDGWYKVRAVVDETLARAARKCKIQVGSKLAMSGVKLEAAKEGTEALKAFDNSQLVLTGNSTSLARWHTKLGFQRRPFLATLSSLSPDGGTVMLLHVIVTKVFPMGYIDAEVESGERPIPRSENEEIQLDEEWRRRRMVEEMAVREEIGRRLSKLEGLAEILERASGHAMPQEDEEQPDIIDDLFDQLESSQDPSALLASCSFKEKMWLARFAHDRCLSERLSVNEEIESEVKERCPPRNTRNFRVVRIEDARTDKRVPMRMAQLTVWDVLSMGEGALDVGNRYIVTNVMPSQKGSWRGPDVEGEIFLSTRRDTRWTKV